MNRKGMLEVVKGVVNTILSNKDEEIIEFLDEQLDLRNDLGFDSLDLAEFTVRLEDECNVDVFEDGLVNNIKEVVDKMISNG